jgi:ribonucleoside-triphosphate reductase
MPQNLNRDLILSFLHDEVSVDELPAPEWGPIGEDVYKRSYSRNILEADGSVAKGWVWKVPEGRTTEVWGETVRRVVLGNLAYADSHNRAEAVELFRLIYEFKMVPAGRHLWMTGVPGAALKNCHRAGWSADISDHFRFLAMQLFTGGGVGSNYSARFRSRGEKVVSSVEVEIACNRDHPDFDAVAEASGSRLWDRNHLVDGLRVMWFKVEDTREGWVDAWCTLIRSAHLPGPWKILFDLSDIRPGGSPLKTMGGRASGPAPLAASLIKIGEILSSAQKGRHISAVEAMSIDHEIAAAIVVGGARRSARMSQLDWNDPEIFDFISYKSDPSIWWSTNISVLVDEDFQRALDAGETHAEAVLKAVSTGMVLNGEPGLYNLALAKLGENRDVSATNPCGEAVLEEHYDPETGLGSASGESCNLGSIDLDAIGTDAFEMDRAFRLMARFLYRATLAPIYDKDQAEIEDRNRRLGVGIMGLQGWCAAHGRKLSQLPDTPFLLRALDRYRQIARRSADEIADELGLPRSIKVTAVAPTGTIAQLRGTTSGIGPVYARYFVRRIQYSDRAPQLAEMVAKGYHVEKSVYAADTSVVAVPVADIIVERHPENLIEQADEISVGDFLSIQAAVQRTFCGGLDGQAISATANIPETGLSADDLAWVLATHLPGIKGATIFPAKTRPQQPITAISKLEWAEAAIKTLGDSNDGSCVGGACPIR